MTDTIETAPKDSTTMNTPSSIPTPGSSTPTGAASDSGNATLREKVSQHGGELRDQVAGRARDYAEQGKEKATSLLDGIARFIDDTATSLDSQLGGNVGQYAHRMSGAVAGLTDTLKSKDVEQLVQDAREAVRRNPVVAIGAAAAAGFVLVRLIKSATGSSTPDEAPASADDIKVEG